MPETPPTAQPPVSDEALEMARALVREFPGCFWFWHPDASVDDHAGCRQVVHELRKNGGRREWQAAKDLLGCL